MNYVKTGVLLIILTVILVWVGSSIGGPSGATIAFIFAMIINGLSYWFSDKIVLTMYRAYEIPRDQYHHLYDMVEQLTHSAGLPMPRLYMIETETPNAFATGRDPQHACLAVTKGLLQILEENELRGVLAHELAHVRNRDTLIMTITASVAGAIMMIATMARWIAILGGGARNRQGSGNIFSLIAISIIAPFAALIVQLAISRSREFGADAAGAKMANDPRGLAAALQKLGTASRHRGFQASPETAHLFIVKPFRTGFISNLFSTHPPVSERVRRLQAFKA